ncbi:MAG: hypothetical protein K9M75_03455 [Phycisphaerae bacterium]|nr:hypothetical protein [Phycisphaerae bacterium]
MKIFLSWSGEISKRISHEVRGCISSIFENRVIFFHSPDIRKGRFWPEELFGNMGTCDSAIICITPENQKAPWILFEAGAIARRMFEKKRRPIGVVCPIFFGFHDVDADGPLSCFQITLYNKADFFKLVESINDELDHANKLPNKDLRELFEVHWKTLKSRANQVLRSNDLPTTGADRLGKIIHSLKKNKIFVFISVCIALSIIPFMIVSGSYEARFKTEWGKTDGVLKSFELSDSFSNYLSNKIEEIKKADPNDSMSKMGYDSYGYKVGSIAIPCDEINMLITYEVEGQPYSTAKIGKAGITYSKYLEVLENLNKPVEVHYINESPKNGYLYNPKFSSRIFMMILPIIWFFIAIYIGMSICNMKSKTTRRTFKVE